MFIRWIVAIKLFMMVCSAVEYVITAYITADPPTALLKAATLFREEV
jgi:hypothetical protein